MLGRGISAEGEGRRMPEERREGMSSEEDADVEVRHGVGFSRGGEVLSYNGEAIAMRCQCSERFKRYCCIV